MKASPKKRIYDLFLDIDAGKQYRFAGFTFKNHKFVNKDRLKPYQYIRPGEIFDVAKVRRSLEYWRGVYGDAGFINMTSVPETDVDEQKRTVAIVIDLDEGLPYYWGEVKVLGIPEADSERLVKRAGIIKGETFRWPEVVALSRAVGKGVDYDADSDIHRDDRTQTINLTLDARYQTCPKWR